LFASLEGEQQDCLNGLQDVVNTFSE
jgi:hypothetical protein